MSSGFPALPALLVSTLLLAAPLASGAETTQQHVHNMSHHVMPFTMKDTIHLFRMTETGGIQRVLLREDGDSSQLMHIRHHLQMEADLFRQGNFSDPQRLHGDNMPGLAELRANPGTMQVEYFEEAQGAGIRFTTSDIKTLTAIHRWFGAQLSEHGADAKAE